MTIPIFAEEQRPLSARERWVARVAVTVARAISVLPPSAIVRTLTVISRFSRPATAHQALSARQAACTVSARCAGQGCLQRSIAVVVLCRFEGSAPDWCTGFINRPFMAHAWVEVDGRAIGEPREIEDFTTVLAVRPHSRPKLQGRLKSR